MAVDPGGTSGVARALVPKRKTIAGCLRAAYMEAYEVHGDPLEQSVRISIDWLDFVAKCQLKHKIPLSRLVLVSESFQLRQRHVELTPLEIRSMMSGLLFQHDKTIIEQTASQAKTFATDERLRAWGVYVSGSAHKRDAIRHICLQVANQLG